MKTTFKLLGLALLSSMLLFTSCNNEEDKVDPPTSLKREIVNDFDVVFTWAGNADSYELNLNGKIENNILAKTYTASGLAEGTYTWQVRAKKGGDYSDWVSGPSFTIEEEGDNPATLTKPDGLGTENISAFSAVVKFRKTNDAEKYEINIGGTLTEIIKDSTSRASDQYEYCYSPVELAPNTSYTWRVRAIKGDERSEWAEGTFKTLANPGGTWTKVTFQQGNYKEFWAVHAIQGGATGGVEATSYFDEDAKYAILNVISLPQVPASAENIRPHRGAFLTFPGELGTYPLTSLTEQLYVDYSDRSYITYDERRGDWVSLQGTGAVGSITVTRAEWDSRNNVYWVSGTFSAAIYDSRSINAGESDLPTATLKVEVSSMSLGLSPGK